MAVSTNKPAADEIDIRLDDLSDGHVINLLEQHRREMFKHSPPESVHALDVEGMRSSRVTFWSAWYQGEFAGCGALKELDALQAELKSMKTHPKYLRKGVAAALLESILAVAKQRDYQQVSLETGTMDAFHAARTLYNKRGFVKCEPFADYIEDKNSVCMKLVF